jgi:hypothetical protein
MSPKFDSGQIAREPGIPSPRPPRFEPCTDRRQTGESVPMALRWFGRFTSS